MRYGTKWLITLLATLAALAVLIPAIVAGAIGMGRMGGGMSGQGMMGACPMNGTGMAGTCPMGGTGMMVDGGWNQGLLVGLNGLAMLALWGAVIVGVVLALRWFTGRTATAADDSLAILRRRYAAGEIDGATYAEMRASLHA